jgi:hypothetical protein
MRDSKHRPLHFVALLSAIGGLAMLVPTVRGADVDAADRGDDDAAMLARAIDRILEAHWQDQTVTPSDPADDAEFFRRVHLDLAGKIPTVAEVRQFLADDAPDKRRRAVERLLAGPNYVSNFANVWRSVMLPEADADLQVRFLVPAFESWLRQKLIDDTPYDEIVREILVLPLDSRDGAARNVYEQGSSPLAFYQAKQVQPENLAAASARIFLGLRIECAQCHDHPEEAWKQEQFWSYAAFFAGIHREGESGVFGNVREIADRRELAIPDTETVVQAAFLDGGEPRWKFNVGARNTLADWMLADDNPYFARAAANRIWAHLFGIGLVDPVDDMGPGNPPSDSELLDELARAFVEHDYDVKFLIRAITASRAYQLSSRVTHPSQEDLRRFARMPVRGLTAEQLYDSLLQATGGDEPFDPRRTFTIGETSRNNFYALFSNSTEPRTQRSVSILQALAMMNGQPVRAATNLESSRLLSAVIEYPWMDTTQRLETLYLAALSRPPRDDELARLEEYIKQRGTEQEQAALGDVFWALLNSSEFLLNH